MESNKRKFKYTFVTEKFLDLPVSQNGDDFIQSFTEVVAQSLGADYVWIAMDSGAGENQEGEYCSSSFLRRKIDFRKLFEVRPDSSLWYEDKSQISTNIVANDVERARLPKHMAQSLLSLGVKSLGIFHIRSKTQRLGFAMCVYTSHFHRWRNDEVAEFAALEPSVDSTEDASDISASIASTVLGAKLSEYQRLAGHGNIVMLHTDNRFRVVDVFGNSLALVGVPREELIGDASLWDSVVDRRDRALLRQRIRQIRFRRGELCEELRIVHKKTGEVRWLHLRALPQFSQEGDFLGWEGFGIDVTERREAQIAAIDKSKRLEALIEITRSLEKIQSPTPLLLNGLQKLLTAIGAECGYACLYDKNSKLLDIVATVGFAAEFVGELDGVCKGSSLLRRAIDERRAYLIEDIQSDIRAVKGIAKLESLRSTIMAPMTVGDDVYGALVVFTRTPDNFSQDDLELFRAGAMQVGIALRQLELVDIHRRQTQSLQSLYEINQQLSKTHSIVEMADAIFPILTREFGVRNGWIGLLDEHELSIQGRSGFGPAFADQVSVEMRFQLDETSAEVRLAIEQKRPVMWQRDAKILSPSILLPDALQVIIVPMISLGKVLGVLAVEPSSRATFRTKERIGLLMSIANELATAILISRFESRMADSHKMRMAALLSSGVAHNFNNLLQVIIGQTSLIELQNPLQESIREANKTIADAAHKGATLVSQLSNIATRAPAKRTSCKVRHLLESVVDGYCLEKPSQISCTLHTSLQDSSAFMVNARQIQHVIENLLKNAEEALNNSKVDKRIQVSAQTVSIRVGQISSELAPGHYVRIDVADNGSGMNHEQRSRCFEPFYTTKNVDMNSGVGLTGAGLGLATSYHIIRGHQGIITVKSGAGAGTIFSVYLPLHRESAVGTTPANTDTGLTPQKSGVLLLNLDPSVYPSVLSALESLGFPVLGAFDVSQAIEVLDSSEVSIQRVVVDADIYGEGIEGVVQTLLELNEQVVVLVIGELLKDWRFHNRRVFVRKKPISLWSLQEFINLGPQSNIAN